VPFPFTKFPISRSSKKLLAPQGEDRGEDEDEVCMCCILHLPRPKFVSEVSIWLIPRCSESSAQVLERESALGLLTVRNQRAIDRTALRAGLWRSPGTPSQTPEGIGDALSAGVTGENSPLFTNQPAKMKTDRVLVKYFFAGTTWLRHTNASSPSSNPRLKECDSWMEQIKLLGCPVARCLANAAKQRP
jgi:hypothetical protein